MKALSWLCSAVGGMVVLGLVACIDTRAQGSTPMKVILDTDIGGDIDDAWALGFILSHAEF